MKFKSLKTKLIVLFGACLFTIIGVLVIGGIIAAKKTESCVVNSSKESAVKAAKKQLASDAMSAGLEIEVQLEVALDSARTLSHVLSGVKDKKINLKADRDRINGILQGVLTKNSEFLGTYTCWEPNEPDGLDKVYAGSAGHDNTGRFVPYWFRTPDGQIKLEPLRDYENTEKDENGIRKGQYYLLPRETQKECVIDPYSYDLDGKPVLMTSLIVPIISDGKFYGMAGVDMRLEFIQALAEIVNKKFYSGVGKTAIFSNSGVLAGVSDKPEFLGKSLKSWLPDRWEECLNRLRKGEHEHIEIRDDNVEVTVAVRIGKTETPWGVMISIPIKTVMAEAENMADDAKNAWMNILMYQIFAGIIVILTAFGMIWFVADGIAAPLSKGVTFAKAVASGDLSAELDVRQSDEIGVLADALRNMSIGLRHIMKELSDTVERLSFSSDDLSSLSTQMASSAEEMSAQAGMVAAASEQVAANVSTTASATEESDASVSGIASMTEEMSSTFANVVAFARKTSDNVKLMAKSGHDIAAEIQSTSASLEEMTVSLNEVAKHTSQANQISQNASRRTDRINEKINILSGSSKQIGKVVGIIKKIADQTNMLALNAAIEAAGAGDAGRGFAVVAAEVKELAKQSAEASDEIAGQIERIQESTGDVVQAVSEVSTIIGEIALINEAIAGAAEEQTDTANEIAKSVARNAVTIRQVAINSDESAQLVEQIAKSVHETSETASQVSKHVDELARGIRDVSKSSVQASLGVQEISQNIHGISVAAKDVADGAGRTHTSSQELSGIAGALAEIVSKFKLQRNSKVIRLTILRLIVNVVNKLRRENDNNLNRRRHYVCRARNENRVDNRSSGYAVIKSKRADCRKADQSSAGHQ